MHAPVELADIAADVARICARSPRLHCITNTVAQNYTVIDALHRLDRATLRARTKVS